MSDPRDGRSRVRNILLVVAPLAALMVNGAARAGDGTVIIDNGTIQLGIDLNGCLNATGGTASAGGAHTTLVGLRDIATNYESVSLGDPLEGWGISDLASIVWGGAESQLNGGTLQHLSLSDSGHSGVGSLNESVGSRAFTVHNVLPPIIGPTSEGPPPPPVMRVTHEFHPSKVARLYELEVTVENLSAGTILPRYRRFVDWDPEPGGFDSTYITLLQGPSTAVMNSASTGFQSVDPETALDQSGCTANSDLTDCGPGDLGSAFDFEFPELPPGGLLKFWFYYGAAPTEAGALNALDAVGASAYSLAQTATNGTPMTFMFGFKAPWAIVDNGTVEIGVDMFSSLNVHGETASAGDLAGPEAVREPSTPLTGLRQVSTNWESLSFGNPREGWGVADLTTNNSAATTSFADGNSPKIAFEPEGLSPTVGFHMSPVDLEVRGTGTLGDSVGRRVVVKTIAGDPAIFEVIHDWHPSKATPELYECWVFLHNISGSSVTPRYRRIADWDIEPTTTFETVSIQYPNPSEVVASVGNGFVSPDPLVAQTTGTTPCAQDSPFLHCGPGDLGMAIDVELPAIAAGGTEQFAIYYGAAPGEAATLNALAAVGANVYSLAAPTLAGPTPEIVLPVFAFGFRDVLFVDDFETGDRSRWTSTVPAP